MPTKIPRRLPLNNRTCVACLAPSIPLWQPAWNDVGGGGSAHRHIARAWHAAHPESAVCAYAIVPWHAHEDSVEPQQAAALYSTTAWNANNARFLGQAHMIEVQMNPVFFVVIGLITLTIIANRRGWGYIPFALFGGCLALFGIVGGLTGLAIIPDGVDIFTFLGCSIIMLIGTGYMIIKPHRNK